MEQHTCQVDGCEVPIPKTWVMCRRHWQMLPRPMRKSVWSSYLVGEELGPASGTRDALDWIAERESPR